MLIVTARLPRRKLAFSVAAAALVCCAALALNFGGDAAQAAMTSSLPSPKGVKTNEDRVAYLEGYGWQVAQEPLATEELMIPEEMDESYDDYLALQTSQGFDLEQYAGKRVKRYTYEITNYPQLPHRRSGRPCQPNDLPKHRHRRRGPLPPDGRIPPRPGHAGRVMIPPPESSLLRGCFFHAFRPGTIYKNQRKKLCCPPIFLKFFQAD